MARYVSDIITFPFPSNLAGLAFAHGLRAGHTLISLL